MSVLYEPMLREGCKTNHNENFLQKGGGRLESFFLTVYTVKRGFNSVSLTQEYVILNSDSLGRSFGIFI